MLRITVYSTSFWIRTGFNADPDPGIWYRTFLKIKICKIYRYLFQGLHAGRTTVPGTGEAFSSQKRTSSTSIERIPVLISSFFSFVVG
jgi:hypothetical protein